MPDFKKYAAEARQFTDFLYLHVMGEPLLHPQLDQLLAEAGALGLRVAITTNGTLLASRLPLLLAHRDTLYKVSVSLHSFEANDGSGLSFPTYLSQVITSARALGEAGIITALRLWNEEKKDGITPPRNQLNAQVLAALRTAFPDPWTPNRRGEKMGPSVYLEWGEKFDWPTDNGSLPDLGPRPHCFAMKDHIAILCDGRVLPCCLDCDGLMPLGDLHQHSLAHILAAPPATHFLQALAQNRLPYPLCRHCNFER